MKFQKVGMRIGPTGLLKVGTMMTIGGMTNGWRAVMVNGYGYTWQQEPVQSAELSASHDNRSDVQKTGSVGSMIINPLLYDLTCETTGGLRFVHEHDLAVDSPSCGSRCGCNGAELEFADMEAEKKTCG